MKKYGTLIIFFVLVALWAAFFTSIKFLVWGDQASTLKPDLQTITGYLSFWGIFAYLIGWAFAVTFLKKYYLFIIAILSLFFVTFAYLVWFAYHIVLGTVIVMLGFLYGLWSVVKSVIIAIEIKKTWLSDTLLNALVGIIFVVFLVWGTVLGNVLFEQLGRHGYLAIMWMLWITAWLSLMLDYDGKTFKSLIRLGWKNYYIERRKSLKHAMKLFIPDLKYISKNYILVMFVSAFLWSISTVVSEVSMEYSILNFSLEASTASKIFLYSAFGAIIGNLLSIKMWSKRWTFWIIFSSIFSLLIVAFPFLSFTFAHMSFLAFLLWLFFGISSNLVDAYFIKTIGEEDKKEYGSSTYGFVLSITLFLMMFLSNGIQNYFWHTVLMLILWGSMAVASWALFISKRS